MTRTTLLALASRVEAATGADRALAKDIYRAIFDAPELGHPNGYGWREDDSGWWLATGEDARTPPKTIYPPKWLTSLDAAMSLYITIPERIPSNPRLATAEALRQRAIAGSLPND